MSPRRTRPALTAGALVLVLTGCEFEGAASIPLPGGKGTGSDAYQVQVEFPDVLDLVPQSAVKVDEVTVGSVTDIDLRGYTAVVTISVEPDVSVPANSRASLRQTSLLGEKFVSLERPADSESSSRELRDGDVIGLDRTTRSAEIEEVLSALSLVLNGGSLEQLQVINSEIVNALEGRETEVKDVLTQLDRFVGGLDAQKAQLVRALDSLDRLTTRLVGERQTIATALEDIPPGVEALTRQREDLTRLLEGLDRLGDVATRTIQASQQNTVADLRALQPILAQLNAAGADLPNALELLTTYPFPRTVSEGIKGDYANLYITLDGNLAQVGDFLGLPDVPGLPVAAPPAAAAAPGAAPAPAAPAAPTDPAAPPALPVPAPSPSPGGPGIGDLLDPLRSGASTGGLLGLLIGGLR